MRKSHFVRVVDHLGRISIPEPMRFRFNDGDFAAIQFVMQNKRIFLLPYLPGCFLCGSMVDVRKVGKKMICDECAGFLKQSAEGFLCDHFQQVQQIL